MLNNSYVPPNVNLYWLCSLWPCSSSSCICRSYDVEAHKFSRKRLPAELLPPASGASQEVIAGVCGYGLTNDMRGIKLSPERCFCFLLNKSNSTHAAFDYHASLISIYLTLVSIKYQSPVVLFPVRRFVC